MKKLLTAAAVVATLGVALPAAAQSWNGGYGGGYGGSYGSGYGAGYGGGYRSDRNIEVRIERGVRNGSLTPVEARLLHRELEDVRRLEWQFERNGLNGREARELDRRYAWLEARLRQESRDRDYRYDGRGYGSGYGFGYR